jgi:hypothetical protein
MIVIGPIEAEEGRLFNTAIIDRRAVKRTSEPKGSAKAIQPGSNLVHRFLRTDHLGRIHVIHDGLYPGL